MIINKRQYHDSKLADFNQFGPLLQRIYAARDVSAEQLDKSFQSLIPFEQLKGIEDAVTRLEQAVMSQQRILIVGDFDADGATSTSVAVKSLKLFGAKHIEYLVPNRFEFGYGLTPEIIAVAKRWQPDVIITVDNGISSIEGVNAANEQGIDVVITDHHLAGNELPNACAIVNPNQPGCEFPSKNIAGVGVIYFVMLALRRQLINQQWFDDENIPNMANLLDLVALGTVADVVSLDQNNRVLVQQGLNRIRQGRCCPGILALLKIAKRDYATLQASDLGFSIAPRLNAAGRLDDMSLGIACLLSETHVNAMKFAQELDELNHERKQIEQDMKEQAFTVLAKISLDKDSLPLGLCLFDKSWHQGVIGILAGRLKEKFYRPVIAFADAGNGELKGSARSVAGIHIRDVLDEIAVNNPSLITKFGGHAMAAGLSLHHDDFDQFSLAFDEQVSKHLTKEQCVGEVLTDGPLIYSELNLDTALLLESAGPWGQNFPEPVFDNEFEIIEQRIVGMKHLKLVLTHPDSSQLIDAIAFNIDLTQWPNYRTNRVQLVYRLNINYYQGRRKLQLMVEYLQAI